MRAAILPLLFLSLFSFGQSKLDLSELKERARSNTIGGSSMLGVGLVLGASAMIHERYAAMPKVGKNYDKELWQRNANTVILAVSGGCLIVAGSAVLGVGLRQRTLYNSKKGSLAFDILGNGVSLRYTF